MHSDKAKRSGTSGKNNRFMNYEETIRDIKKELRASMNGILSAKMREVGMPYKLCFGVELPRLLDIAREFPANHQLAQQLWNENIRETKILATILMPVDAFYPEVADIWVGEMPSAEIAQIAVQQLFMRLPYAPERAFRWIASDAELTQLCGFLIIARLLSRGEQLNDRSMEELKDQMEAVRPNASLPLRKAIMAIENEISFRESEDIK